jgi:hypothetical protein
VISVRMGAVRLSVGKPEVTTVVFTQQLFERITPCLHSCPLDLWCSVQSWGDQSPLLGAHPRRPGQEMIDASYTSAASRASRRRRSVRD